MTLPTGINSNTFIIVWFVCGHSYYYIFLTKLPIGGENTGRQTRSGVQVLSAVRTGVLAEICLFCKKNQRRTSSKREKLSLIMTIPFQSSLLEEATELIGDFDMLRQINGIDLVAKEGRYHNTCRKEYGCQRKAQAKRKAREEIEQCERQRNVKIRKEAFGSTTEFIQCHFIEKDEAIYLIFHLLF